jgi:hypothetical protein
VPLGANAVLRASIENLGTKPLKNITVTPSYQPPGGAPIVSGPPIPLADLPPSGEHKGVSLPKLGSLLPTDYKVTVSGSPITETTLTFLGTDDGLRAELPLGDFTGLFGLDSFIVPMLRAFDDTTDLFVGVDLTEWLSDPRPFAAGDVFSFVNGVDSDLPGFVIGTSPIDLLSGLITDLFTGDVAVVASIDGEIVPAPEPGSVILLLTSLIGLTLLGGTCDAYWRSARCFR